MIEGGTARLVGQANDSGRVRPAPGSGPSRLRRTRPRPRTNPTAVSPNEPDRARLERVGDSLRQSHARMSLEGIDGVDPGRGAVASRTAPAPRTGGPETASQSPLVAPFRGETILASLAAPNEAR